MARIVVDNEKNIYPGTVSIADLAQYATDADGIQVKSRDSTKMHIYYVAGVYLNEYAHEIQEWSFEYGTGFSARFKDGSAIHISASGECSDEEAETYLW